MNRTGPEQERDTEGDTPLTVHAEKPKQHNTPAGWRRGYAADCKADSFSPESKPVSLKSYHDKPGTAGERGTDQQGGGSTLSRHMRPAHKRMARMLGYSLTIDAPDGWHGFSAVAQAHMTKAERVSLAYAALNTLSSEEAAMVASAVLRPAGYPLPPFLGGMSDARDWASFASRRELIAYATAAFEAMTLPDQAAFRRQLSTVGIAA